MINAKSSKSKFVAFTLVELLVVIGIIAVLISILLPALSKARSNANALLTLANLRQIGIGLQLYATDNGGMLPPGDGWMTWFAGINPYLGATTGTNSKVLQDPDAMMLGGSVHFTTNPLVMPSVTRNYNGFYKPYQLAKVRPASEIITVMTGSQVAAKSWNSEYNAYMLDGGFMYGVPYRDSASAANLAAPISPGQNRDDLGPAPAYSAPPAADVRWRQLGGKAGSFLFGDSHAETRRMGEVLHGNLRAYKN